jgi:hypothetical protein
LGYTDVRGHLRMNKIIYFILLLVVYSCSNPDSNNIKSNKNTEKEEYRKKANWEERDSLAYFKCEPVLEAIGESQIKESNIETYCLYHNQSFGQNHEFIKLEKKGDSFLLSYKVFQYSRHTDSQAKIIKNRKFTKTKKEWDSVQALISGSYFWSLHSMEQAAMAYDGYSYSIVGRRIFEYDNQYELSYHIVYRQNPHEGTFKNLCEYLKEMVKE